MLKKHKANRFANTPFNKYQNIYIDNGVTDDSEYPTRLNFYDKRPTTEFTIEEFELFALDRLQVLKTIEAAMLRNKRGPELKQHMDQALEKYLPLHSNVSKAPNLMEERRKDHFSHFVLRLAYCRSAEKRAWFIRQECALFKYRFEQETADERAKFVSSLDLRWTLVTPEEKERIKPQLEACAKLKAREKQQVARDYVSKETFFKVDFEKVPDLVAARRVYIEGGQAYVAMAEQISLVMDEFKASLTSELEATAKIYARMEEDSRLRPVLQNIEKQYFGKDYSGTTTVEGAIKASDVDQLVHQHAPLCMSNLHSALRANKHLQHGGRLQYGLFLKSLGLRIDEALFFWQQAFSNITGDKFQKEYAYSIRHNYGLEGKRQDYAAYSCMKIIQGNPPSTGDHHGCPFRHFSKDNLEARLYNAHLSSPQVIEVMKLVENKHYQIACTRYFEMTHPKLNGTIEPIQHPTQYYELSKALAESNTTPSVRDPMDTD
ncbi:DNA primase large subunit Spp2 [Dichotomocladium elegans]|nr:DNA primase large subunit Spp2 [Dichotomocladium elegans]